MNTRNEQFRDRKQAGEELAGAIGECPGDCIVLAIPRGGVVVGYEVAARLGLPLDVIVPRKIGAPNQPELAIGAVTSWGDHDRIIDERTVRLLGVSDSYIEREADRQLEEINRRLLLYRGSPNPPDLEGRNVILVDDGIATGYTTKAAAIAIKRLGAKSVTLAVPVGPPDSIESLRPFVDKLICLMIPLQFYAVGYWYRDFEQTTDAEVTELLRKARLTQGSR